MIAILWLILGVALAVGEALSGALFLLMLAGGALAAAGFSALTDFSPVVDVGVFAVVSGLLVVGVRPIALRHMRGNHIPMGLEALPGRTAEVLETVERGAGLVKLNGETWTARPMDESDSFPTGSTVHVVRIDGATAIVWGGI